MEDQLPNGGLGASDVDLLYSKPLDIFEEFERKTFGDSAVSEGAGALFGREERKSPNIFDEIKVRTGRKNEKTDCV